MTTKIDGEVSPVLEENNENSRSWGRDYYLGVIYSSFKKLFFGEHQFVYEQDHSHTEEFTDCATDLPDLSEGEKIPKKNCSTNNQIESYNSFEEVPMMTVHSFGNEVQEDKQVNLNSTQVNEEGLSVCESDTDVSKRVAIQEELNLSNEASNNNRERSSPPRYGIFKLPWKDVSSSKGGSGETCQFEGKVQKLKDITHEYIKESEKTQNITQSSNKSCENESRPSNCPKMIFLKGKFSTVDWESLGNAYNINSKAISNENSLISNENSGEKVDERNSSGVLEFVTETIINLKEKISSKNTENSKEGISKDQVKNQLQNFHQTSGATKEIPFINTKEAIGEEVNDENKKQLSELLATTLPELIVSQSETEMKECQASEANINNQTSQTNTFHTSKDTNISFIKLTPLNNEDYPAPNEVGNTQSNVVDLENEKQVIIRPNSEHRGSVHEIPITHTNNVEEFRINKNLKNESEKELINTSADLIANVEVTESTDFPQYVVIDTPATRESAEREASTASTRSGSPLRKNEGIISSNIKGTTRIPIVQKIPIKSKLARIDIKNIYKASNSTNSDDTLVGTVRKRFANPLQQEIIYVKISTCENNGISEDVSKEDEIPEENDASKPKSQQPTVHKYSKMRKSGPNKSKSQSKLPKKIYTNKWGKIPSYETNDEYHRENGFRNMTVSLNQN